MTWNLPIHELWDEPWEGLPEEEGAWNWDLVSTFENGATKQPPNAVGGWKRWYFVYRTPDGDEVKISADREPKTGKWFNPHRSSGEI